MKCTAVLTCEKIIIDKEGAHSIINVMLNAELVMQRIEPAQAPEQTAIPKDAVAPIVWWVYTVWHPSSEDIGKTFEQVYQTYWPNGEKFMESRMDVVMRDDGPMQTTFHIGGLPAGQVGKLKILTWLDHQGHRASEISEAYITIKHRTTVPGGTPMVAHTT
jgi:hypothetical protein